MTPPPANPLTFDEHRDLGRELQKTRARLLHLYDLAMNVYGSQSRPAFTFQEVNEALDRLCHEMQAQAEIDCPGLSASDFYK